MSSIDWEGLRRLRITAVTRRPAADNQYFELSFLQTNANPSANAVEVGPGEQYQHIGGGHDSLLSARSRVSGLFYAGPYRWDSRQMPMIDAEKDVRQYWGRHARRQYGTHVYCQRTGNLSMVTLELKNGKQFYVTSPEPINQLYPCVRFEIGGQYGGIDGMNAFEGTVNGNCETWWAPTGEQNRPFTYTACYWLSAGLAYRRFTSNQYLTTGDRYYARSPALYFDSHRWGAVHELTDSNATQVITDMMADSAGQAARFVLYVCAGAKLIVTDPYLETVDPMGKQKNFTLVQAGGFVVVEGDLELKAPQSGKLSRPFQLQNYAKGDKTLFKCLLSPAGRLKDNPPAKGSVKTVPTVTDPVLERLSKIKSPVLFLAPNESEYGSIAWHLVIEHNVRTSQATGVTPEPKSEDRHYYLVIPEGGRFEAIEDWESGGRELLARYQYERLYEPTVEMDTGCHIHPGNVFAVPAQRAMLDKILGIGADRTIYTNICLMSCNYYNKQTARDRAPLPVVYNSFKCTQWPGGRQKPNLRPFVRPDWPLIQYKEMPKYKCFRTAGASLMSTQWARRDHSQQQAVDPSDRLYRSANAFKDNNQKEYFTVRKGRHPMDVYEYKRLPYGQWLTDDQFDGQKAYVGIDGCHYWKIGAQPVGRYDALYYAYAGAPAETVPSMKSSTAPVVSKGKGKTG